MSLRTHVAGIHGWSRFQPERGYDFNGTAIVAGGGTVLLVDPVPTNGEERQAIRALGTRFEIVLLTSDHERDAAALASELGATVHVARPDLPFLKLNGAIPFDDGHLFAGGFRATILPSMKTPGETVLFNAARRVLVVGDAVIADPVTGLRLVPPAKLKDRAGALQALRGVCELDFDALLVGDGFVLPSGGREALRRFLERAT